MKNLERIVMISPVGLEKDRVLAGFKKFGATNLYLIQSEEKEGMEKKLADTVREFALELKMYLEKILDEIIIEEANITDLESCLETLKKIIIQEIRTQVDKIYVNVSTSSKVFAIASIYIAGLYPDLVIPFYAKTSDYIIQEFIEILSDRHKLENKEKREELIKNLIDIKESFEKSGWTKGEYEISLIPALPFKRFTDFQKRIFKLLLENQNKLRLKEIMEVLKGVELSERSFRSKLSYALRDLIDYGLIKKSREGKYAILNLTEIGHIFGNYLI